jgi:type IV pilus assembly protein PilB
MNLKDRVLAILRENGLLSEEALEKALETQKQSGASLNDILASMGVEEKTLLLMLARDLGIPLIELSRFKIPPQLTAIIPLPLARKYKVIPIGKLQDTLTVAMSDPSNVLLFDDLKRITGLDINPVLASSRDLEEALVRVYGDTTKEEIDNILEDSASGALEVIREEQGGAAEVSLQDVKEGPVVKMTNYILKSAVEKKTSDLLIEPMEKRMRVRFRIDGILREQESPPANMLPLIISRIKVMSNLNIAEHRLPQDGRFRMTVRGREVDFRVSIVPTVLGEKATLRILDKHAAMLDIERLGFEEDICQKLVAVGERPSGMILTCGPTGSGKTTTLYSLLKVVDSPEKNIITVEDPVEYELKGINQVQVNSDVGLTFAASLRSILRQDPDIILVGEIRDFETVDVSIKAALTGHLVLSTVHTTTACGTVTRFVNMGIEPFLVASSLLGVLSQRLVRKLCDKCKEPCEIPDSLRKELRLDAKTQVFRSRGCSDCNNLGYKGRLCICEYVEINKEMKEAIVAGASESELKRTARSHGFRGMRDDAVRKLVRGQISVEEVFRTTIDDA